MNQVEALTDQLRRAYTGEAWHGPSLRTLLEGVTAGQAAVKPLPGGHSVWELVMHVGVWMSAVRGRLRGETAQVTPEQDWPVVDAGSDSAWQQTLAALDGEHDSLLNAVAALPEADLRNRVAGQPYSVWFMLNGVIQHNLYHAGQIALLKKAFAANETAASQAAS